MKKIVSIKYIIDEQNDQYELNCALNAIKLNSSIHDALDAIRSRLKYGTNLLEEEIILLTQLRSALSEYYVEG